MSRLGSHHQMPIQRLGRWDGREFVPVTPASIDAPAVHVFTHGWCPGLADAAARGGETFRVWDEAATTPEGVRFDRWFRPLADAILADDPEAVVLAYSWADESATRDSALSSVNSQRRTTINGMRLAAALRKALKGTEQRVHLLGFSHGSKVVSVAATLMDPAPHHLTTLDSPEGLLPVLGGAFNDLGSYMRVLLERDPGDLVIDNYISRFGVQYGKTTGLGSVTDVVLDPAIHPLEGSTNEHGYAWAWYLHTAQNPDCGVGYAWSPLRGEPAEYRPSQLRQVPGDDPFSLEVNPGVSAATGRAELKTRARTRRERTTVLSTEGRTKVRRLFWRRTGDTWASAPISWRHGPDAAFVRVKAAGAERARTIKGWSDSADRTLHIPLSGARPGPTIVEVELVSHAPAEIEYRSAPAVHGFALPLGSELRSLARPLVFAATAAVAVLAVRVVTKGAMRIAESVRDRP